jgi:hypothetical protein
VLLQIKRDHPGCPLLEQPLADRAADPLRRAGDDRCSAREAIRASRAEATR